MKTIVYLAGACECETKEVRSGWRKECEELLAGDVGSGFSVFNPLAFFDYDCLRHQSESEVFRFEHRAVVQKANVVLVNLTNIRRSVGTICELAWAYDHDVPIVAFGSTLDLHPWILTMCDRIVSNLEGAVEYIKEYYSPLP